MICELQSEIAGTAIFKECMTNEAAQAAFTDGAIESINKDDIKKASDDMTTTDKLGAYLYVLGIGKIAVRRLRRKSNDGML